jgi:hypothetical protein
MRMQSFWGMACAAVFLAGGAGVRAEFLRGGINSWGTSDFMTLDEGLGNIYKVTLPAGAANPASEFKFDRTINWAQEHWGSAAGSSLATVNGTIGLAKYNGGANGNLTFNQANGKHYTFSLADPSTYWDRNYVVMETDSTPVSITSVSDNHADRDTNTVTVTIGLSASKSAQESLWVRYSRFSNFSSSTLLPSSGSGTNYTATIPGQPSGTSVYYYVLSSTMPSNVITSNFDLCTLQGNNNSGANYSYLVGDPAPVFGNCWHFPTNEEPASVTMRNPTNPTPSADTYIYVGNYHPDGNMTGGWVFYKESTAGTWSSNSLAHDSDSGDNKYWKAAIPSNALALGETLQYYLQVTYSAGVDTTYLGTTTQADNVKYATPAEAAANPFEATSGASLGNAWHVPANAEPAGAYMRNPRHPYADNAVTIYNGNQFQGEGNAADQSGGTLHYRLQGSGGWSNVALSFDSEVENNKYWKGVIPANAFDPTDTVEYVVEVAYTDRDTTYLGRSEDGTASQRFASLSAAQAEAFFFTYGGDPGTEPGFVWHGGNAVRIGGDTVQIWAKIGFEDTNGYRWADHAEVRYLVTTQAMSPTSRQGVTRLSRTGPEPKNGSSGLTSTNAMSYSHAEADSSENGNAMWWVATITDAGLADANAYLRYEVAAWNSAANGGNDVVRKAEWQADGANDEIFEYRMYSAGSGDLTVNGLSADYTTSKFFIDEAAAETVAIEVRYTPPAGAENVEVFSNVGRRDLANATVDNGGIPHGIRPPDGNLVTTNDTDYYYTAFSMTYDAGEGAYLWSTNVGQCGAYRLTARYQTPEQAGTTNWTWYSSEGRRDHAVVISPKKVHRLTMYELNPLTIKATSADKAGRSTFADLLEGGDSFSEFNLNYLNRMQINCLWFQPIHPSAVTTRGDPSGYEPGSPYATRDYFAVSKWFAADETEAGALSEFQDFVAACDTNLTSVGSINVMLDGVFNHTAWDAIVGQGGVDLFSYSATDSMPGTRPGWYSYWQDYGEPATFYNDVYDNDIAVAPDRGDFGKWADTADLYFGKYSALVRHNPDNNGDYLNEQDVYDFAGMTQDTIDLWRYFAYYSTYWLEQTGHSLSNQPGVVDANGVPLDDYGIDGLRCDFGQGLPPQFWEYFINHTRSMKWNFIFMAETLDGGVPGYRSNRHFDVLNEDILFMFHNDIDANTIRSAVEQRRNSYNGGTILLNQSSHDETMPSEDPWQTASYYGAVSTVDGIPMLFNGQEWGIRPAGSGTGGAQEGFALFELNFGKWIPHFKQWNKATFWTDPPSLSDGLAQWHGRVNWARLNSPALQSRNRYFLNNMDGNPDSRIMSVAKYETANAGPAASDVVLAFALVLGSSHAEASATYNLQGAWAVLGLDTGKTYRVRNLASSDASAYIESGWPRTGQDLWDNGIYVGFSAGVGEGNAITDDGALVQYLKLEEVQPGEETAESPVPVPYAWLDTYYPGEHSAQDYEDLAMQLAANGLMSVWEAFVAYLDPTDDEAYFLFQNVQSLGSGAGNTITLPVAPDRAYRIEFTDSALTDEPVVWQEFEASGSWTNTEPYDTTHTFTDDGTVATSGAPFGSFRTYRVWVGLP